MSSTRKLPPPEDELGELRAELGALRLAVQTLELRQQAMALALAQVVAGPALDVLNAIIIEEGKP